MGLEVIQLGWIICNHHYLHFLLG